MNKVEAQIVKRPSIDPVTVANNANQALYKNCRQWREYATALEEDVRNLSERVVELDSKSEDQQPEISKLKSEIDWLHGLLDGRNEEVVQTVKMLNEAVPDLPEVPQFVGEWLDRKPLYAINGFIPVEIIEWSKKQTGYADLGMNINHLIKLKVNGCTVAKEKHFYLKHIDFCKRDKDYDWYMIKHSDGPLNHLRVEKGTLPPTVDTYFTKQEIDNMTTDSYEQIEVEE